MEPTPSNSSVYLVSLLLVFLLFSFSSAGNVCHPSDQKVLLQIAKDLSIPDWDPNTTPDCCAIWFGVGCNNNGRVISLIYNLYGTEAQGPQQLPPSLGGLPFLETLNINGNLTGTIPKSIANLANLQDLQLDMGLSGPIPDFLSRLTELNTLALSPNSFTGSIPSSLGKLTRLTYLDLFNNQLTGPIPESIGQLTRLDHLDFSGNQLTGPLPASLGRLTNISRFDLRDNQITGSIPVTFGSFKNPQLLLFLSDNQLSGPVPKSLGQARVNLLDLSSNQLIGDPSCLFGRNKPWLQTLYLDYNNFKFDFSNVELPLGLRNLFINQNQIYGSLPKQLGQLPLGPRGLDVSNNHLCGMIPTGRRLKYISPDAFANNTCLCGTPLPPCK